MRSLSREVETAVVATPTPAIVNTTPALQPETPAGTETISQPANPPVEQNLPDIRQVSATRGYMIDPLHLDIHVYAGDPSKRFVFDNMKKYRQGDQLVEGPIIEEITRIGAILSFQGDRFRLDRE